MNFDDYEKKYEAVYAEFAAIIKFILEKAIASADDVSPPQLIQFRAKEPLRLKAKLEARKLLSSDSIENEIRDLAGIRPIFYTNTDVDGFLNSGLVSANFEVDKDGTKIHHPLDKSEEQRYQAIHYTVRLKPERLALPEYAKFKGMRCEIQIQTILNHAWAETSHDMLYKPSESAGFGSGALDSIKKRMMKVMDNYLIPAGYEFQKVQHDYDRLMQGKALFDRGTLETLAKCRDNNERHEILSTIREYVIPNYDDIRSVYPEIGRALVDAISASRTSETKPIESPFGNFPGKTIKDIAEIIIDIFDSLRYVDVEGTLHSLIAIYKDETDADVHKRILNTVEHLAKYNLDVWRQVGSSVQLALTEIIERLNLEERKVLRPIILTIWRALLNPELSGASFSFDKVTISTGSVQVDSNIQAIREKAISGLAELLDNSSSETEKRNIISALEVGMRAPMNYSNELCALILQDSKRIVSLLTARMAGQPYELLEHIEHNLLRQYRRARSIVSDEKDRLGCKEAASVLIKSILVFRDQLNADNSYVRYKTLVGFESVFPPHWEDDAFDYQEAENYRKQKIAEYVAVVSEATEDEWYQLIERCAATKSNDMATFPIFSEFLTTLSKTKPVVAINILKRADENTLNFLAAFLNGLFDSAAGEEYKKIVEGYISDNKRLGELVRHFQMIGEIQPSYVKEALSKAIVNGDNVTVMECLVLAIKKHDAATQPLIADVFMPGIEYLISKQDARWVWGAWYLPKNASFFNELSARQIELVLKSLLPLSKIDHQAESILTRIADKNPEAIWKFFGQRLHDEHEDKENYEAIPYQFHGLEKKLSQYPDLAVDTVRGWFQTDDVLFRFHGGRLLSAAFPDFPETFARKLSSLITNGTDEDIGFIIGILENYRGNPATYETLKQIIDTLPENDRRLNAVAVCIESTGVVMGAFGFVEAYREKKAAITSWLHDGRPKVKQFAKGYIRRLDQQIAAEQRRAEQQLELRKREFDDDKVTDPEGV